MHIVTGLVIAGLAGRMKRNKALGGLPRFRTGPIQVAHAVPGRIRFVVPSLRGEDAGGSTWLEEFGNLRGVKKVEANGVTGSVVLTYDPNQVDPPLLFGALARLLELDEELLRPRAPLVLKELREAGKSLNLAVYDSSNGMVDLRTLAVLGLIIMGARKTMANGWAAFPAGFTLLWWAVNALSRGSEEIL